MYICVYIYIYMIVFLCVCVTVHIGRAVRLAEERSLHGSGMQRYLSLGGRDSMLVAISRAAITSLNAVTFAEASDLVAISRLQFHVEFKSNRGHPSYSHGLRLDRGLLT